ncbi:MAG: ATP-dependent DNA helicase RecG [Verrucomicrobiota bacterium]
MIAATTGLSGLDFLQPKEREALTEAGIVTAGDLLEWFPKRYEDRRSFRGFPFQPEAMPVCLHGVIRDVTSRRFGGRSFVNAVVADETGGAFGSGTIHCRWFNMPFMAKIAAAGQQVVVYGRVKDSKGGFVMDHPEMEILREQDVAPDSIHLGRVVPIYRNVPGLSQRRLREVMHAALPRVESSDWVPGAEAEKPKQKILRDAHFPATPEIGKQALRLLAREEFFLLQLRMLWRKERRRAREGRSQAHKMRLLTEFYRSLPFDLTNAQKRSIREIIADMRCPQPMNRLLQGDVGTGKTFVAMAAMLLAVDSGCQAVLMAPTQILAEQHYLTFLRWLAPLGVRLSLKTGARDESSHLEMAGRSQILIGTHALLHDVPQMVDVGLIVIDEQHKFGVGQRSGLVRKGELPDVLVMTATPIPRTLTMTLYGDLDCSLLDEKPSGRGRLITRLRVAPKQKDVTSFVLGELEKGRQAYLVYPLVEESAGLKAESAAAAQAKWRMRLPGYEVGLLHGRLKSDEKEEIMRRFRDGAIHALVATSVVEVGVDVPNATVMILHHAERFGLAQLHQLRGRIGRGEHTGYCVLLTDGKNPEGLEKLQIIEEMNDGFQIAEADLRIRGPGEVAGKRQSGMDGLAFASFLTDAALVREARALTEQVLAMDPGLNTDFSALRPMLGDDGEELG